MKINKLIRDLYQKLPAVRELNHIKQEIMREKLLVNQLIGHADAMLRMEVCKDERFMDDRRLLKYGFQVCSQNNEDGMIHEILKRLDVQTGSFVEIGVGNGHENNTAFLLSRGWKGYWIEGDPAFLETIGQPEYSAYSVTGKQVFVTRENISNVFKELKIPIELDLLSIDVDRNTYYIWEGLSEYRPKVVVVEYNAAMPPDIDWVIDYAPQKIWDGSQNFGASLLAYEILARRFGYSLVGCDFIGINAFFVRDDCLNTNADRFCSPFTSKNHYEPPRYRLSQRFTHPGKLLTSPPSR